MAFEQIAFSMLLQGGGLAFFLLPLNELALDLYLLGTLLFIGAACLLWLAPRPPRH